MSKFIKTTYRIKIVTYADKQTKYFVQYSYLGLYWSSVLDGYCESPLFFHSLIDAADQIEKMIDEEAARKVISITYTYPRGKP